MDLEQKFRKLREQDSDESEQDKLTFSLALLGKRAWFPKDVREMRTNTVLSSVDTAEKEEVVVSEKGHMLDSFQEFAKKETETKPVGEKIIELRGGQIEVLDDAGTHTTLNCASTDPFRSSLEGIEVLGGEFSGIKCLFLGDTPLKDEEDLLIKMITAMKLQTGEYLRLPLENIAPDSIEFEDLCLGLRKINPDIIVTLGAVATNTMLGKKERLSRVHGQIKDRTVKFSDDITYSYKMVPIFHPDFLKINPKMKRTAWNDLQKIMHLLGKSTI